MNTKNKPIILSVVIIILVLACGLIFINRRNHTNSMSVQNTPVSQQSRTATSNLSQTPTMNTNTSDQQLDTDTKNIEDSLNGLQSDQTKVDQSITQSSSDQSNY